MEGRSDASLAALLLTQRLVDLAVAPLSAAEYWTVLERIPDPATLLGLAATDVAARAGVDATLGRRIARLLDAAPAIAAVLGELEQSGVRAVTAVDVDYPDRLRALAERAPPVLYVAGDPRLMTTPLLGISGSREPADDAVRVAGDAAGAAVAHRVGIVTGGSPGVDRAAMQAAHEAAGVAVVVLADPLLATMDDPAVGPAITDGLLCACTPYAPAAPRTDAAAMARNPIIYALSRATLVVACDEGRDSTWGGATDALDRAVAPVLVWTGPGAGTSNAALVARGAAPVAAIDDLFPLPPDRVAHRPPGGGSEDQR